MNHSQFLDLREQNTKMISNQIIICCENESTNFISTEAVWKHSTRPKSLKMFDIDLQLSKMHKEKSLKIHANELKTC